MKYTWGTPIVFLFFYRTPPSPNSPPLAKLLCDIFIYNWPKPIVYALIYTSNNRLPMFSTKNSSTGSAKFRVLLLKDSIQLSILQSHGCTTTLWDDTKRQHDVHFDKIVPLFKESARSLLGMFRVLLVSRQCIYLFPSIQSYQVRI